MKGPHRISASIARDLVTLTDAALGRFARTFEETKRILQGQAPLPKLPNRQQFARDAKTAARSSGQKEIFRRPSEDNRDTEINMAEHRGLIRQACPAFPEALVSIVIEYLDTSLNVNLRNIVTTIHSEQEVLCFFRKMAKVVLAILDAGIPLAEYDPSEYSGVLSKSQQDVFESDDFAAFIPLF